MTSISCRSCRFFVPKWEVENSAGECRKKTPYVMHGASWGKFPMVEPDTWCGEYRAKSQASLFPKPEGT